MNKVKNKLYKYDGKIYTKLGKTQLIRYSAENYLMLYKSLRLFCYNLNKECVVLSAANATFSKVEPGVYAIILRGADKIGAKSLIKIIEDLSRFQTYIYLEIDNDAFAEYIRNSFANIDIVT